MDTCPRAARPLAGGDGLPQLVEGGDIRNVGVTVLPRQLEQALLHAEVDTDRALDWGEQLWGHGPTTVDPTLP